MFMPIVVLLLGILLGAPALAAETVPPLQGGAFLAEDDSLGFDAFRRLPANLQFEKRDQARDWAARARDLRQSAHRPREAASKEALLRRAIDHMATAVGYCPYMPELWLDYAALSHELGRYGDVEHCLYQARRTLRFETSGSRRAKLETRWNRLTAIVAYNVGDLERSRDAAQAVVEAEPEDAETRLLLARSLIELEDFDGAREQLALFDDTDPAYARAQAVLAILEMRAGRLEVAERVFENAYRYGMRGATFDNDRGRLFLEMERYDEAVERFENALKSVPSFMEARNNLGVAHRRAGREDLAEAVWQSALELDPMYGPAHFNLAELYRRQMEDASDKDRQSLASLSYEHYSLALEAGYDPELVVERRARLALSADDLEQAERDLLRATESPRFGPRVLLLLARVKKQQGRLDIAQSLLEMASTKDPEDALVQSELGEVRLRRLDYAGAREALERACALQGDLVATRINLSIACMELGDLEAAETAWRTAAALAPDDEVVRHQRQVLDERERRGVERERR